MHNKALQGKKEYSKAVYILLLLLVAVIWGYGFIATDDARLGGVGPSMTIAVRFLIAALVIYIVRLFRKDDGSKRKIGRKEVVFGFICGVVNFLGFFMQTVGLKYTDPGRSGMITASYVILVPILSSIIYKKFSFVAILNAVVFFFGLLLLVDLKEVGGFRLGDILTFFSACFFAVQILLVEKFCTRFDVLSFNLIQMLAMGCLGLVLAAITEWETFSQIQISKVAFPLLFLGFFSSAFAYLVQTGAQRKVSSSLTAILLSMESVVSVIFSLAMGRTEYSTLLMVGGVIMVLASISASLTDVKLPLETKRADKSGEEL